MRRQLTWTVLADGNTDRVLVPIIQWAVHRLDPDVEILEPTFRRRRASLDQDVAKHVGEAMLLFAHRDAENVGLEERLDEFNNVAEKSVVPVVPVRMSEAWILFDGHAIAQAAGSPSSQVAVPKIADLERIGNPKDRLENLLFQAAGKPAGRRGRNFKRSIVERRVTVAEHIADFAPLEGLPAFVKFQRTLAERYPYRDAMERE